MVKLTVVTAGVVWCEVGQVVDLAVDDNPAVAGLGMLADLGSRYLLRHTVGFKSFHFLCLKVNKTRITYLGVGTGQINS